MVLNSGNFTETKFKIIAINYKHKFACFLIYTKTLENQRSIELLFLTFLNCANMCAYVSCHENAPCVKILYILQEANK